MMNRKLKKILCIAGLTVFSAYLSVYAEEQGPVFSGEGFAVETVPWVHTSWRNKELKITFYATNSLAKPVKLELSPVITDVRTEKAEKTAGKYTVELAPGVSEEVFFTMPATGLKTWSHWDPQLYTMDISVKAEGKDAGSLPQVQFGYREMWTENGYFYINGKRVFLRGGNHGGRRIPDEIAGALYANFNADTIRGVPANDNEPERAMRLADEAGLYLFVKGDPIPNEEWKKQVSYEYANSPSLVGFAGHSSGYYSGPHGHPLMLGSIITDELKEEYREEHPNYFELPKQINEMYPDWVYGHYVHGIGGNFRSLMWDLNYSVPMQSQEEWMNIWAKNKDQIEPFFPQEFALNRYGADQMRMDRRGGLSILIENTARFFGDKSYQMFDKIDIPTYLPESLEKHPANMAGSSPLYFKMKSYVYGRLVPAWRTWGSAHMLMHVDGHPSRIRVNTPLADVFRPIFAELYFYLAGPQDDFTDKDHAFYPGETISKSGIVLNDTETDQTVAVSWKISDAKGKIVKEEKKTVTVGQGETAFIPVSLTAPKVDAKTDFTIHAECHDSKGDLVRADSLAFRVFPQKKLEAPSEILLIDTEDTTVDMFKNEGIAVKLLSTEEENLTDSLKALENAALLIIGRNSYPKAVEILKSEEAQKALRNGMNIVMLEQLNRSVMGLTLDQTHTRDAFIRDPYNPLTAGLDNADLQNWRGESSLFPSYPSFDEESLWYWHTYSYQGQYTSFRHRRAWYWSNKAMVATMCFEKPQFGNFKILIDAWYDLMGTPLVEFQVGKGRILFCQLDMTDHVGISPVAKVVMNRILAEYSKPAKAELLPVGTLSPATKELLSALRMVSSDRMEGNVLILTPKDIDALTSGQQQKLSEFVKNGGAVLARVETQAQADKLPVKATVQITEDGVWNPEFPDHPVFGGLGPSDLFLREPMVYPRITGFTEAKESAINEYGIAGVAGLGKGMVVLLQAPADKFEDAKSADFSGRAKLLRIYSSILTKLGGLSNVAPDPELIGGWGIQHEWMPGFNERVPRGAPKVRRSPLYERPALNWDPDAHVSF